ncbi:hypothetical protein EU524_01895 [Candidatus Thorarchaeota archaeon]|nr:MAG: hypothetical protein EU524_01895 [Candidatus Thorarchaeota archaeon]
MVTTRYDSYREDRDDNRPVRLDRTEGFVVIEGKAYPARELVEALAQSGYAELRANGDALVLGRKRITPIFKSSQERAMASLCHGSLAYCCPLSKRCAERDRALEVLGLTKEDYEQLKERSHSRFMDTSKGFSPAGGLWEYDGRGRAVNRPAVDTGFGSDDYRRDFDTLDRALQSGDHREATSRSRPRDGRDQQEYGSREKGAFKEVPIGRRLQDDYGGSSRESARACSVEPDASVEGLGALFTQGELSPFNEDMETESSRPSFCFSCGRTIERGTSRCPYCGASQ